MKYLSVPKSGAGENSRTANVLKSSLLPDFNNIKTALRDKVLKKVLKSSPDPQ